MPKPNVISSHVSLGAAVSEHQAAIVEAIIAGVERLEGRRRMVDVLTLEGLRHGPAEDDYDCIVIIRIIEQNDDGVTGVTATGTMTKAGIALDSNNSEMLAILREYIEMSMSVDTERSIVILDRDDVRRIKEERDSE